MTNSGRTRETLGGHRRINAYVDAKLKQLYEGDRSFASLYFLMFSERENILYERSDGERLVCTTYGEALARIEALAAGFGSLGLPAGSVVGLYMDNSLEWILAFWMLLRSGYRPLLMNLRLPEAVLSKALHECGARCVISDGKRFSAPTLLLSDIPEATPRDAAFGSEVLVMSSGTSEHLKICAYGAEEFFWQILDSYQVIRQCRPIKRHYAGRLKLLTFLPFYHVFGLVAMYIWFAFFSRTFVHLPDYAPETILATVRRHKVTHIFAVPLFWDQVYTQAIKTIGARGEKTYEAFSKALSIANRIGDVPVLGAAFRQFAFRELRENLFGDSIRFMITGGSEIRPEVLSFFNAIGYPLANGYGMTEIGITSVDLRKRAKQRNRGDVGRPLSSVEYRISAEGELLVRGSSLARYILMDGQRMERADWFHTRDLAQCHKGYYKIIGRQDDLVISPTGENLNPNLIEPLLSAPGAKDLCLIGLREAEGMTPALLVQVEGHCTKARAAAIRMALRDCLRANQLSAAIGKILLTDEPLIRDGEIKRNRLRLARDCREGRLHILTPERKDAQEDARMAHLRVLFAEALGKKPEAICRDADFFLDEGGTSLDYFALLSRLQEEYAISILPNQGLTSLEALYDYLEAANAHVD